MSMKAQILFLFSIYCFLIGSTPVMKAQTGKFYSTDKELSNSLINAVYQDRKGFIWIATENGLNKFDGTRFSIYRHNATDSTSLKNNYVRTLFEVAVISGSDASMAYSDMTAPQTTFTNYSSLGKTDERILISLPLLNAGTEIFG